MKLAKHLMRLLPCSMRHSLIRRACRPDDAELADLEVRIATSVDEYVQAAKLVHDAYVARGIIEPHGSGVRMTPFLALPSTIVFVALEKGKLVGTASLVVDSSLGLPMEKIYPAEVQALRARGRKIAEGGALSVIETYRGKGVPYLLYKAAMLCASRLLGVDDLLGAVHPDAEEMYTATLGVDRIGDEKAYPALNRSALAVALKLNLRDLSANLSHSFGHLPPSLSNPYHLYCERLEPQIRLPRSPQFLSELAKVHRQATMKLAALRPDILMAADTADFERLRHELAQPESGPRLRLVASGCGRGPSLLVC